MFSLAALCTVISAASDGGIIYAAVVFMWLGMLGGMVACMDDRYIIARFTHDSLQYLFFCGISGPLLCLLRVKTRLFEIFVNL